MKGGHEASPDDRSFLERVMRFHDGLMSAEEMAAFEGELIADSARRRVFAETQIRCASLHERFRQEAYAAALPRLGKVGSPWLQWRHYAAAAALLAAGVCLGQTGLFAWWRTLQQPRESPPAIATLLIAEDCDWRGAKPKEEGQRLGAGPLLLGRGLAVVRFDNGAAAALNGPVDSILESRSSVFLRRGSITVRAAGTSAGFIVRTPATEVTDLGTEFSITVEKGGATEIHVREGSVSYRKSKAASDAEAEVSGEELLGAGTAVRFDSPGQQTPRAVAFQPSSFDDTVRGALRRESPDDLLARESFAYQEDELPLMNANGGTGWEGPWHRVHRWPVPDDPERPMRLGARTAFGRLLDASNGFPPITRRFAMPIRMDRDGVYYLSARVRWEPGNAPSKHMRQVRVILRSSRDPKHGLYILNFPASCLCPQIQRHDLQVFTGRTKVPAGDLQLWVVKIVAHEHGNDELHFRIFAEHEPTGLMEPGDWHLSLTQERSDAVLDMISLCTYLAPDPVAFGDLRLGTAWRSVVEEIPHE